MKSVTALAGAVAIALITTTAVAGDESQGSKHTTAKFEKFDADKDGRLSKDEVRSEQTITAQFAAVDQNSDGYLSQTEYTAMMRSKPSQSEWSGRDDAGHDQSDHDRQP